MPLEPHQALHINVNNNQMALINPNNPNNSTGNETNPFCKSHVEMNTLSLINNELSEFNTKLDNKIKELLNQLNSIDNNSELKLLINDLSNMKNFSKVLQDRSHNEYLNFIQIIQTLSLNPDDEKTLIELASFLEVI